MWDILSGVAFIHSCKVLHRDLKPQNVLVSKDNKVKIADFGLARTFSNELRPYSQEVVTLWYRAPELLAGHPEYGTAVDMWSVGCIFFELITRRVLFKTSSAQSQIVAIVALLGQAPAQEYPSLTHVKPEFPPAFDASMAAAGLDPIETDFLRQCLRFSPEKRMSAKQALSHPYFDELQ